MLQDLRYAIRTLAGSPGFTIVALLALALGIGANTAIFTVVNAVLLRALPFREPDRLVMIWEKPPKGSGRNTVNPVNFLDWRERNRVFEGISAVFQLPSNLTGEGEPEQIFAGLVSSNFFTLLGVSPALGRTFLPEEEQSGKSPIGANAVLSYGLWQRRFGGDPGILGRSITLNDRTVKVIGVMPSGFAFPNLKADLWTPYVTNRGSQEGRYLSTVARLKAGVSLTQAQMEMEGIMRQIAQERPEFNAKWSATVVPLHEQAVGDVRQALLVLLAAVGFVMLTACANVANLLLIRATGRTREIAVRAALGAGRFRIIRQLLVESTLLAIAGGAIGLLLAWWGVRALPSLIPPSVPLPRIGEIGLDIRVLAFTLLLSLATGVLFGLAPAFQVSRVDLQEALKQGGRSGAVPGARWLRGGLVAAEVAVSLLLLIGAGLMIRSFIELQRVDPGFRSDHVLTMSLFMGPSRFARSGPLLDQIMTRVHALPQVGAAGAIHFLPLTGRNSGTAVYPSEIPAPGPGSQSGALFSIITPGYLHALGIQFLQGRDFEERDRAGSGRVVIINESAARQFYPGENAIGKRLYVASGFGKGPKEVVGIVRDIRHDALREKPKPAVFLPYDQNPSMYSTLVIRSSGDPAQLTNAVKAEIHAVDKNLPVSEIRSMDGVLADSIARPRVQSMLLSLFATLALVLATVGIYGVISYSVSRRTQEIGIRMALGACGANIVKLVLMEGVLLTSAGLVCGIAAALALTRYLATFLYGVAATDAAVFGGISALLMAVALVATVIPARRAARVDPMVALRHE
jgi:putative ABC transport system permease protein